MTEEKKCPCDAVTNMAKEVKTQGEKIHKGDVTLAEIGVKLETIEKRFDKFEEKIDIQFEKLNNKIQCIELQPVKKWDSLVGAGIGSVVGAIVTAITLLLTSSGG